MGLEAGAVGVAAAHSEPPPDPASTSGTQSASTLGEVADRSQRCSVAGRVTLRGGCRDASRPTPGPHSTQRKDNTGKDEARRWCRMWDSPAKLR